jgi:hypothetical protein
MMMWFSKLEFICKVQINNCKSEYLNIKSHKLQASITNISANYKFITLQNTILFNYVMKTNKTHTFHINVLI